MTDLLSTSLIPPTGPSPQATPSISLFIKDILTNLYGNKHELVPKKATHPKMKEKTIKKETLSV